MITGLILVVLSVPFHTVRAAGDPAQRMLKVSPVIFQISLSPGKTTTHTIRLENLTDSGIAVRAEVQPLETADSGDEPAGSEGINQQLTSFISIPKPDQLIPSGGAVDVPFTITLPGEIPLGGYYAMIYLTPLYPVRAAGSPVVVPRIGIPVLGSVGVPQGLTADRRARITASRILNPLTAKTELDMLLAVKNTSLHHFSAKPMVTVSTFGYAKTQVIPEKIILPGKIRTWNEKVPLPGYGIFKIVMAVSLGGGEIIRTTAFAASLPVPMIAVLIIISIVLPAFAYRRKQIFKALRILLHGK